MMDLLNCRLLSFAVELDSLVIAICLPTKVARSSKILNYSFVPIGGRGLIWILVYVLAAQTSVGQADPKLKIIQQRVWKNK